jgi:hypothetical protein
MKKAAAEANPSPATPSLEEFVRKELAKEREANDAKFRAMMDEVAASRQPAGPGVVATAAGAATSAATVLVTAAGVAGGMASNFVGGFLNAEIVGERVTDDGYLVRTRETLGGVLRKEIAMTASAVIRGAGNGAREWAGVDSKGRQLDIIDADDEDGWGTQEYALAAVGVAAAGGAAYGGYRMLSSRGGGEMDEDGNVLPYNVADGGV